MSKPLRDAKGRFTKAPVIPYVYEPVSFAIMAWHRCNDHGCRRVRGHYGVHARKRGFDVDIW